MKKVYTVDDVLAMKESEKIVLHSGVIITPAARDLAVARGIEIQTITTSSDDSKATGLNGHDKIQLRRLIQEKLGGNAESREVDAAMREVLRRLSSAKEGSTYSPTNKQSVRRAAEVVAPGKVAISQSTEPSGATGRSRIIISVVGLNQPGIVAGITTVIADLRGNIADISQRIMEDFFIMIIVVDIEGSTHDFDAFSTALQEKGESLGVKVWVQHEDMFRYVHRI